MTCSAEADSLEIAPKEMLRRLKSFSKRTDLNIFMPIPIADSPKKE